MKIDRHQMGDWVLQALSDMGGVGHYLEVAKHVYNNHETDIRAAGDYFYKWQYEMRWAGALMSKEGRMVKDAMGRRGVWALSSVKLL